MTGETHEITGGSLADIAFLRLIFEREKLAEHEKPRHTMSLRVDRDIPMGKVDDLKQALRRSKALIVNYSARMEYENQGR